jgi:hypothetical protein
MNNFEPHIHICEIQLLNDNWRTYCPFEGEIGENEEKCDFCKHLIIVNFLDDEMIMIKNITRMKC